MSTIMGMYVSTVCTYVKVHICWRQMPLCRLSQKDPAGFLHYLFFRWRMYVSQFFFHFGVYLNAYSTRVSYFQNSYSGGPSLLSGSAKRLLLGLVYWSLGIVFTLWSRFSSCRLCWPTYFVYKVASKLVVVFLSFSFDWLSIGVRFLELKLG